MIRSFDVTQAYADLIERIGQWTGAPYPLIHLHVGMIIYLGAVVALRRSFSSFVPLAVVAAAEAGNEILDRLEHGSWRWPDTSGDIVNTLFWPLMIVLIARYYRSARG